jgi:hypothetical protein
MNVQGPDGAVVSFPDGTDPATVYQVMRQNFGGGGAAQQGGGLPVLTDDGSNWNAPQGQSQPGLLSRMGNAIAHPVQTVEDAWNYPGSYLGDAAKGMGEAARSAATLPGDVATGKVDMNDPSQGGSNAQRVLSAALLASPARAASVDSALVKLGSPTTESLYGAGGKGFDAWRNSSLQYDPQGAATWATQFQQGLNKEGVLDVPAGAPSTHAILGKVANPPPNALDMEPGDLDSIRKSFVKTAQGAGANATERTAANDAKASFLDWLQNAKPTNGTPTNAPTNAMAQPTATAAGADAVGGLRAAIGNWAAASRGDLLDNISSNAELRDEVSHSGHGGGNPLRQAVAAALRRNPSTGQNLLSRSGFNDEEQAAVRAAIPGGVVRTASNLAGGGLGHAGAVGGILAAKEGFETGGIPGAIVGGSLPFIGSGLRALDRGAVSKGLANASDLVRSRSPLADTGAISTVTPSMFPTVQSRLIRALMAQQGQQQQP